MFEQLAFANNHVDNSIRTKHPSSENILIPCSYIFHMSKCNECLNNHNMLSAIKCPS
uniref:Uncharacterized protein n=1 Tax=Arundo donax TaxID=35708 RepID=A0A0A8YVM3_ARUDO